MSFLKSCLVFIACLSLFPALASDDHDDDHSHQEKTKEPSKGKDDHTEKDEHGHQEEDGHSDAATDEHGHGEGGHEEGGHEEEEAPKNVGPNKGIVEFDEKKGFKLSAEAEKTFAIATQELAGFSPWSIPDTAVLSAAAERSVYKINNGFIKRTRVSVISKGKREVVISAKDLKAGDKIIIRGLNYIRTAELDLTSGESGHSH